MPYAANDVWCVAQHEQFRLACGIECDETGVASRQCFKSDVEQTAMGARQLRAQPCASRWNRAQGRHSQVLRRFQRRQFGSAIAYRTLQREFGDRRRTRAGCYRCLRKREVDP